MRWNIKDESSPRGPIGIFGYFQVASNLWFILLTSNTFLGHVFHTCAFPHHEYARVDRVIHSTDPFFAVVRPRVLYVSMIPHINHVRVGMILFKMNHVFLVIHHILPHVCVPHYEHAKGNTLHSNGACLRLDAVHAALNAWVPFL